MARETSRTVLSGADDLRPPGDFDFATYVRASAPGRVRRDLDVKALDVEADVRVVLHDPPGRRFRGSGCPMAGEGNRDIV